MLSIKIATHLLLQKPHFLRYDKILFLESFGGCLVVKISLTTCASASAHVHIARNLKTTNTQNIIKVFKDVLNYYFCVCVIPYLINFK